MTNQLTPDRQLDAALQALLLDPVQLDEDAVARSRAASAARLDALITPPRPAPRRTRRRIVVAVAASLAIVAGIALAPDLRKGGEQRAAIPDLPATASAAEALEWAGDVLVTSGSGAQGSGDVWHSVSRTWRDGELRGVSESWRSGRAADRSSISLGRVGLKRERAVLEVVTFDGSTERRRNYVRLLAEGDWKVSPSVGPQVDIPGGMAIGASPLGGPLGLLTDREGRPINADDQDPADHPVQRVSATVPMDEGRQRWLHAVTNARSAAELERATYVYLRTTRGYFVGDVGDRNADAERSTTVRQLVSLLTIAHVSPQALRSIYAEFAAVGRLQRLDDVSIGGRDAIRIQYETGNIDGSILELAAPGEGVRWLADEATVLVIDRATGRVLRTESIDRRNWTEFDVPNRVESVLDEPAVCTIERFDVPCDDVLDGGELAAAADREARTQLATSMGAAMAQPPFVGRIDEDGLPLDPYDEPLEMPSGFGIMCDGECDPLYPLAELPGRGPERPSSGE